MADQLPPDKEPEKQGVNHIDIPVPTKNPRFWMNIIRKAYRESLTFGLLSVVLMLIGIGVDVGGISFSHTGWSAEIVGIKMQNAGPGDLLLVAAVFIFWTSRFHVKTRRIFSARAQLKIHAAAGASKVLGEPDGNDTPKPPDDTELWDTVVEMQEQLSTLFTRIALGLLFVGFGLVFFGFDLSAVNWTAEGFGLKLVNTGPGVTLVMAGAIVYYGSRFSAGVEDLGDTRTAIERRAKIDQQPHTKPDGNANGGDK